VRVPFGGVHDDDEVGPYLVPGAVLARGVANLPLPADRPAKGSFTVDLATPWGALAVEVRDEDKLLAVLPAPNVVAPRVMLAMAAARLGIEAKRIESSGMPMQTLEMGRAILVVPVAEADHVRSTAADADAAQVPGAKAEAGVVYARTQRTPYVKVLGRVLGGADPLAALSVAAVHLVTNGGVRPTYPRTRVVGELVDREGERCEMTLDLVQAGHGPRVKLVLVGGTIERLDG